jgi:hypothetical protein
MMPQEFSSRRQQLLISQGAFGKNLKPSLSKADIANLEAGAAEIPEQVVAYLQRLESAFSQTKALRLHEFMASGEESPRLIYYAKNSDLCFFEQDIADRFARSADIHHSFIWDVFLDLKELGYDPVLTLFFPDAYNQWLQETGKCHNQASLQEWASYQRPIARDQFSGYHDEKVIEFIDFPRIDAYYSVNRFFLEPEVEDIWDHFDNQFLTAEKMLVAGYTRDEVIAALIKGNPLADIDNVSAEAFDYVASIVDVLLEDPDTQRSIRQMATWKKEHGISDERDIDKLALIISQLMQRD